MSEITRRTALKTTACAGLVLTGACSKKKTTDNNAAVSQTEGIPQLKSEDFYTNGAFDAKKALQAYYDMMNRFNYPISDVLKTDEFWTCDFLQKDFMKLGMAGIFWINQLGTYGKNGAGKYQGEFKDQQFGYLSHEIYLLPGQMLPEHGHVGNGGDKGLGPKMESWHVRYGSVDFFGEYKGAGDETLISDMAEADRPWGYGEDWFKSKFVATRTAKSGKVYTLEDPQSWHFQRAGKEGAIVSEYATYHNHVYFSKPGLEFKSTEA